MDSVQFLDAVRDRHGIPSDVKLAKFLGIDHSRVSLYRTRRRRLDPDACIKVAKALELPPEHVFALVQAERAKRTEHRRIWERLARIAKQAHMLAVVGLAVFVTGETYSPPAAAGFNDGLYIMRSALRAAWRRFCAVWRPFGGRPLPA